MRAPRGSPALSWRPSRSEPCGPCPRSAPALARAPVPSLVGDAPCGAELELALNGWPRSPWSVSPAGQASLLCGGLVPPEARGGRLWLGRGRRGCGGAGRAGQCGQGDGTAPSSPGTPTLPRTLRSRLLP